MNSFETQVAATLREYGMLDASDSVLVGVSGGPDSVALLLCLSRLARAWHLQITAAHLNHRIRGAESDGDERFVHSLGSRLGVPVISEALDVPAAAASARSNLEETAREVRYAFFRRQAARVGARRVAVGHTLDDQAETVLMRLLRGSGMRGLAGIYPVVSGTIIRPLIDTTRRQVLRYLEGAGLDYREDSSNSETSHLRNRVRRDLLPYLRAGYNPRVHRVLAREARLARQVSEYLESVAAEELRRLKLDSNLDVALRRSGLLALPSALQNEVLRTAVRECRGSLRGVTAAQIDDILTIARGESGRSAALGRGIVASREFDTLILSCASAVARPEYSYEMAWPGVCTVPEAGLKFTAEVGDAGTHKGSHQGNRAVLDPDHLPPLLTVRTRRQGDRYGGPGHRKVKKLLIDAHVPRSSRESLPMVVAGNAVIWIPGFDPAKSFRAMPGTGRCVILVCESLTGS